MTLAEVAASCGVSRMTVSNAYNRPGQLSAELRQRVLAAADELGYGGPSAAGRALKGAAVMCSACCSQRPCRTRSGIRARSRFLHGVTAATAAAGLALQLIPAAAETAERLVRDAAVDGLIAHSPADDDPALAVALHQQAAHRGVRRAQFRGRGLRHPVHNNEAAAAGAARHLIGLGHRTLGVVTWHLHPDGHTGWVGEARQASARYEVFRLRLLGYQHDTAKSRLAAGGRAGMGTAGP